MVTSLLTLPFIGRFSYSPKNQPLGLEAVSIEKDIAAIKTSILEDDTKVLIIDPMIAWLDAKRDSNDYRDVQVVLGAIDALLADVGASCVGITHFNKSTGPLENRIMGSRGWSARVRSQISIVPDDGDDRIVGHLKCNYGPLQESLKFGILVKTVAKDADDGSPVKASLIEERGASELTARDAMVAADNRHLKKGDNPREKAIVWLIEFFENVDLEGKSKGVLSKTIYDEAKKNGCERSTVWPHSSLCGINEMREIGEIRETRFTRFTFQGTPLRWVLGWVTYRIQPHDSRNTETSH